MGRSLRLVRPVRVVRPVPTVHLSPVTFPSTSVRQDFSQHLLGMAFQQLEFGQASLQSLFGLFIMDDCSALHTYHCLFGHRPWKCLNSSQPSTLVRPYHSFSITDIQAKNHEHFFAQMRVYAQVNTCTPRTETQQQMGAN